MKRGAVVGKNEGGYAAIVVAMVLITVLALITIGFTELANREQQDALASQLSNQAYYAAESAVNDVYEALYVNKTLPLQSLTEADRSQCLPLSSFGYLSSTVDNQDGVTITCVLLDLNPPALNWNDIPDGGSGDAISNTGAALSSMTIKWGSGISTGSSAHEQTEPTGGLAPNSLPPSSTWNASPNAADDGLPVIEVSVTPVGNSTTNPTSLPISRSGLIGNTYAAYLYPSSATNCTATNPCNYYPNSEGASNQAPILDATCTGAGSSAQPCSITISNFGGVDNEFIVHVAAFYGAANVSISGKDASGNDVSFTGQGVVDVTARAHNTLRRFQAVIEPSNEYPDNAIVAGDVCKRMRTTPNFGTVFVDPGGTPTLAATDPCNLTVNN